MLLKVVSANHIKAKDTTDFFIQLTVNDINHLNDLTILN